MNLLLDQLPETVDIGGTEYEIHTDFRTSILFEILMQEEDIPLEDKILDALELYFPEIPAGEDPGDIVKAMLWFYQCGKGKAIETEEKEDDKEAEDTTTEDATSTRAYSFQYDDDYIYAAFQQVYGIDLNEISYLHWWKFRALFKGLDSDCEFVKIMGYRTTKITSTMSKGEKNFIRKMQRIHALPVSPKETAEMEELEKALLAGGDLTGLV